MRSFVELQLYYHILHHSYNLAQIIVNILGILGAPQLEKRYGGFDGDKYDKRFIHRIAILIHTILKRNAARYITDVIDGCLRDPKWKRGQEGGG